jgi:hypothetical protein
MKTLTLITNSLRSIGVIRVTQAPSAEQGATALENLNNLMASLAEDGIDFGYAPTTDIGDDISLPLGHVDTIQALLARKEASDRGIDLPEWVATTAAAGYQRLLGRAVSLQIQRAQSDTLPLGEHNRGRYDITRGW